MKDLLRYANIIILLISIGSIACMYSCEKKRKAHSILPSGCRILNGDIVLRHGTGIASRAVMYADAGSDYSHCGIAITYGKRIMVVHAVPDEPDFNGDVDRVKMESIENFYSSIRASKGCILRCTDKTIAEKAARKAKELYHKNILFDHNYNIEDSTEMYCSELVEVAYFANGIDLSEGRRHNINLPGINLRNVIFPSDFLKSRLLRTVMIFEDKYTENI